MKKPNILLAQLNSNGDCLYATVIAKQIKEIDFPGCHLTWAVNSKCKQSVLLNPYVDEIWEIATAKAITTEKEWSIFVQEAESKKEDGDFDFIFYTQVIGKNTVNFDGGIRSSMYNNYPYPITVSHQPVIQLSEREVLNVAEFAKTHHLHEYKNVVLLECGPDSFRSSLNVASALQFAKLVTTTYPDIAVILSSGKKTETNTQRVIDGSVLSFRENAELTKYCSLFIGCSSGISWLTTTGWAKPLKKIIVTNKSSNYTFSMYYDHLYAGLPAEDIIEFEDRANALSILAQCMEGIINDSFESARNIYHNPNKIGRHKYIYHLSRISFKRGNFKDPIIALQRDFKKNGFDLKTLLSISKAYIKLPVYLVKNAFRKSS